MRREMKVLLVTMALGAVVAWGDRVPHWVSGMESFRIVDIEVNGLRFLTRDAVVTAMEMPQAASVWNDVSEWEAALAEHPLVRSATVERRIPDGLVVTVEERVPVALVPTPTIEPVDADGVRLALDPAEHRLDLPVVSLPRLPADGAVYLPTEGRALVAEVGRLATIHEDFLQRVSDVRWGVRQTLVARWGEPDVDFLLPLGLGSVRIQEGVSALSEAIAASPAEPPHEIDLRFADQVVVRRTSSPPASLFSTDGH